MASTITYEVRVLRHVLESCDWLASRGRDGLAKLKEMARETKWHDGVEYAISSWRFADLANMLVFMK